jgi:hypothetical protein
MTRSTVVRKVGIAAAVALAVVGGMAALGGSGDGGIDATTASVDKAAPSTTVAGRSRASVEASGAGGTASADTDTYAATAAPAPLAPDVASSDAAAETSSGKGVADSAMVVKTGSLSLDIEEGAYDRTVEVLTTKAAGAGGYVAESTTSRSGDQPSGTLVLRVPTPAFDGLLADARKLGEVVDESSQGTDVSGEHTDLQARLTALAATRDKLTLILSKAATVEETLSVQDRITGVQTQIEQLQGQLSSLDDQVAMASLTIDLAEPGADHIDVVRNDDGIGGAWRDARGRFGDGIERIVRGSGSAAVLALVALVLWAAYRIARRRVPAVARLQGEVADQSS